MSRYAPHTESTTIPAVSALARTLTGRSFIPCGSTKIENRVQTNRLRSSDEEMAQIVTCSQQITQAGRKDTLQSICITQATRRPAFFDSPKNKPSSEKHNGYHSFFRHCTGTCSSMKPSSACEPYSDERPPKPAPGAPLAPGNRSQDPNRCSQRSA